MANPVSPVGGTLTPDDPATLSAIRRYEERLARDPTSLAFAPLADAYRKTGRVRDAIRLCREGLERFPHYVTARLILSKALLEFEASGDRAGAEAWFQKYETMPPDLAAALKAIADVPVDLDPQIPFPEGVRLKP